MTDKQKLRRWEFRHDFLIDWISELLVENGGMTKRQAEAYVIEREEKAMSDKGIKYPFKASEY